MDLILSVQNKICTWDGKKLIKILGTVASTKSWENVQLDGIWESMWGFVMESPHFNASSIRDKWHRWKSRPTSKGRYVSGIATVRIGWEVVVRFYWMPWQSAKRSRPPSTRENAVRKTIWRTTQRANNNFWSIGWISSVFTATSVKNSSIWQESATWNLSWLWADRGCNLERRYSWLRIWKIWETLDASDVYPQRIKAKEVLISQKDDEFVFPNADGTAKLSGRDYKFRVPTLRREQLVRSEDLSGDIQGESGESQPAEPVKPVAIFGRFKMTTSIVITLNHEYNSVPKEETFPIPVKHIDVARSTHTDLDVLREKKIDDYWNVDSSKHLSDSWRGFTKFILLKEKPPKGYSWSG